ncbi:hypothetical protein ACFVZ3_05155 [Kitasatospora purpeofusca]|uniref:hypothetical protein n=1 Tax=Kitasatospora purpeofusca TaxID=67352 RepID=UPI00369ED636
MRPSGLSGPPPATARQAVHDAFDDLARRWPDVLAIPSPTACAWQSVRHHVVTVKDPLGNTVTTGYDPLGRPTSVTDPLGRITTTAYDAAGRVTSVTDPTGAVTTNTWNTAGERTKRTDANGRTTTYTYDRLHRIIAVTDPLSRTTRTWYDEEGRRAKTTDRALNRRAGGGGAAGLDGGVHRGGEDGQPAAEVAEHRAGHCRSQRAVGDQGDPLAHRQLRQPVGEHTAGDDTGAEVYRLDLWWIGESPDEDD